MQRTRQELQAMSSEDLVVRVLELQDMLREGLAVRDSLHAVLNRVLNVKEDEVTTNAGQSEAGLSPDEVELKRAWAAARQAVSNPTSLIKFLAEAD
tara:strand:- start:444 stop:731 length:288 start_codon:yes stop_codon:yes gene_type:complete